MPFLYKTSSDEAQMLQTIGVHSIEELFASIPASMRLNRPLDIPRALSELELTQHMRRLGAKNESASSKVCFLGGGAYDHFIPAVVDAIASRGEFYTSYTPYQAEVSQGNMQAMFEYQTMVCQLTGLDVSNASLYDGGSATIEAALLCMDASGRNQKVVVPASLHPEYRAILETYLHPIGAKLVTVPTPSGVVDIEAFAKAIDDSTGCVLLQSPNFFGCFEDVEAITKVAHERGALVAQVFDPISLGLAKRPGDMGVDIAIAEGQCLGNPLQFGGPYLGIMACRDKFIRRLPGRIAGQTIDRLGRICWVLTMQTREQHIRREKATSNICTNQTLLALRASIYLAEVGSQGLRDIAELCIQKAHYAKDRITRNERFEAAFSAPTFKEFVIRDRDRQAREQVERAVNLGYLAGIPLGNWYPELDDCLLVAVTEKRTREEIDGLVSALSHAGALETMHA